MYKFIENKEKLQGFLSMCMNNIEIINSYKDEGSDLRTVFSIASTTKRKGDLMPYITPIRKNKYFAITGAIVFTQVQARLLCIAVDGLVDIVVVDAEKKIPMLIAPDLNVLPDIIRKEKEKETKSSEVVETGNLSAECFASIYKSKIYEFKPNDLTVEAVWAFVSRKLGFLTGRKVAIVGAGNIGSKLALKFVESGVNVGICRRNFYKGNIIASALNQIKSGSTISMVNFEESTLKICFLADIIVGCTEGIPAIEWEHIAASKPESILIDCGKGSFSSNAIRQAHTRNRNVFRTDIGAALDGQLITLMRNDDVMSNEMGRRDLGRISMVSGGILGKEGEIVVDNVNNPKAIIGIADGAGDFTTNHDGKYNEIIAIALDVIRHWDGSNDKEGLI